MKIFNLILLAALFLTACKEEGSNNSEEKTVQEVQSDGKISEIIRNPASANAPTDTDDVAKMTFEKDSYNFGSIDEGEIVEYTFQFTNTGKVPLVITNARATCGCTIPSWPEEAIEPGDGGKIDVRFDSKNKRQGQSVPITITANTYPSTTKIFLNGFVNPKKLNSRQK